MPHMHLEVPGADHRPEDPAGAHLRRVKRTDRILRGPGNKRSFQPLWASPLSTEPRSSPVRHLASLAWAALLVVVLVVTVQPARGDHVAESDIVSVLEKDTIPAILEPSFGTEDPDWLSPSSLVIGIAIGGDARAYPIAILNWHEIVNDVVGGTPVAITFCPLCGTGIVFGRIVNGETLTFGVSGRLYKNDLVMYDHQTESYWTQLLGEGVLGFYHGTRLTVVTSATLSWSQWRDLHPDSQLLDRPVDDRGRFLRDYGYDPYGAYASSPEVWFPQGNVDPYKVLHPKERVLGVVLGGQARAYPESTLKTERVVNDVLGGVPLLVSYVDGVMKAWERGERTFVSSGGPTMADDRGNAYDMISGHGASGNLTEIQATTAFWFAWYDFYPATSIYGITDLRPAPPPNLWEGIPFWASLAGAAIVAAAFLRRFRKRSRARRG